MQVFKINSYVKSYFFMLVSLLLLSACSDPLVAKIAQQTQLTEQRLEQLASALNNDQVRNAKLISQYAKTVRQLKPELATLTSEFEKDSTIDGPMFKSLQDRLNTAKTQPHMFANKQALYSELQNIYQAADPVLYSDALSDPLNVLADMSDGRLPRINALPKSQSMQVNNAQDFGTGEQLIGNPNYGQWTTGSNGMSFWAWYGMYSMMGDLFGSRRVYYHDWGRHRNYSYYNDYGRTRYSSPSQLNKQNQLEQRTKKTFERKGQRYTSAYSKNKMGSSGLSSQSRTAQTSANKYRSNYVAKSSYASKSGSASKNSYGQKSTYGQKSPFGKTSSFRNSSTTTSRGFSRGK